MRRKCGNFTLFSTLILIYDPRKYDEPLIFCPFSFGFLYAAMLPTQAGQSFLDTMTPQPGQYHAQRETPVRKRRRTINSCAGCRKRKSRCDRGQPCSECVANATLEMCQYLESAAKPRNVAVSALPNVLAQLPAQAGPSQTTAEVLQSRELVSQDQDLATRVSQLENILKTQMSLLTQPQPATVQDIRQPTHPNTPPETGRFRFVTGLPVTDEIS
jgi:hypothetical protein